MHTSDRAQLIRTLRLERIIDRLFNEAVKELVHLGIGLDAPGNAPFRFADHPQAKRKADSIIRTLNRNIELTIRNAIKEEWATAQVETDRLCQRYDAALGAPSSSKAHNEGALNAFLTRKGADGLRLSDRVWNCSGQFKDEIENALDIALRDGKSAQETARDIKQYLHHPDKLFRRVRDEHGQLQLSRNARQFHPGRGVYRSSYKNARRLAATETNIAYHTADLTRWQQLDFVIGYEVKTSGTNPNVCPICAELAGKYPKDFKFVGWHPHCRCHAVPILEPVQAFKQRMDALEAGKPTPPPQRINQLPENFTAWQERNQGRIADASKRGSLPYFIRDNFSVARNGSLTPTFYAQSIEAQKMGTYGNKLGRKATKEAQVALADHQTLDNFSEAQMKNFEEINKATGYKRGKVMSFEEAANGQSNISQDTENCASCVVVHEMRLRGYDLSALKYDAQDGSISKLLSEDTRSIWMTAKGKTPEFSALIGGEPEDIIKAIEKQTRPIGSRYHIGWDNRSGGGHIVTLERTERGLVCYDPQVNEFMSLQEIVKDMAQGSKIELLRVDRLLVRGQMFDKITDSISKL